MTWHITNISVTIPLDNREISKVGEHEWCCNEHLHKQGLDVFIRNYEAVWHRQGKCLRDGVGGACRRKTVAHKRGTQGKGFIQPLFFSFPAPVLLFTLLFTAHFPQRQFASHLTSGEPWRLPCWKRSFPELRPHPTKDWFVSVSGLCVWIQPHLWGRTLRSFHPFIATFLG